MLDYGKIVDKNLPFTNRFDFNDLGAGRNAFFDHKYIGVQFQIKRGMHFEIYE